MPAREIAPPPTIEGETDEQLKLMRAGEPYLAMDPYLMRLRQWGQDQVFKLNAVVNMEERMDLMREFVGMPEGDKREVCIMTPFICEYLTGEGFNLSFGKEVYIGPNCTMLDVNRSESSLLSLHGPPPSARSLYTVSFGDRTMVGANCSFYTPGHPISPEERNGGGGAEWGKEIIVGDDCWIGGSVVIVGPCHIGNGVTIGAGSVVTKDIPDRCVAVGNPARVVKKINADGSLERVAKA